MAHVYLLEQAGDGLYKIGIAVDVGARLSMLQAGNPKEIGIVFSAECGNQARVVEAELHSRYQRKRVIREWFALTANDVAEIKWVLDLAQRIAGDAPRRIANSRLRSAETMPSEYVVKYLDQNPHVLDAAGSSMGYREIASEISNDMGVSVDHTTVFRTIKRLRKYAAD